MANPGQESGVGVLTALSGLLYYTNQLSYEYLEPEALIKYKSLRKGLLENNVQRQAYLRWKKLSLKQFQIISA